MSDYDYLTIREIISEQIHETGSFQGGTYTFIQFDGVGQPLFIPTSHLDGYYVSRVGGVENFPFFKPNGNTTITFTSDVINQVWLARNYQSGFYLGLWVDDNGNLSIDETEWISSLPDALYTALNNNQRAIYDIADQKVITV